MLIGITPFYSENQNQMFESIQDREPKFPNSLGLQNETKDVIVQVLKAVDVLAPQEGPQGTSRIQEGSRRNQDAPIFRIGELQRDFRA